MRFIVTNEKTPRLVKFSQSTTNKVPSQLDPFCFVLSVINTNTLSKQGLAFECYIHHLKTIKFLRQIAHLTLDLLIFSGPQKVKDDPIDRLFSPCWQGDDGPTIP